MRIAFGSCMPRIRNITLTGLLVLSAGLNGYSLETAGHRVSLKIQPVSTFALSNPSTADDGGAAESQPETQTVLAWATNQDDWKITVATDLPEQETSLVIEAGSFSDDGAAAADSVTVEADAQDLGYMDKGSGSCTLKYEPAVKTEAVQTITYTITGN